MRNRKQPFWPLHHANYGVSTCANDAGFRLKSVADYGMNSAAKTTNQDATAAIETANRFVVCIHRLVLSQDSLQT
jgi:hypothetical protein